VADCLGVPEERNAMAHILVVDDDEDVRDCFQVASQQIGHEALLCESAESARRLLTWLEPDLVFVDLDLPGEDGVSLAKSLRDIFPLVPVTIMSGDFHSRDNEALLACGASCRLEKPFEVHIFRTMLNDLLCLVDELVICREPKTEEYHSHGAERANCLTEYIYRRLSGSMSRRKLDEAFEDTLCDVPDDGLVNVLWDLRESSLMALSPREIADIAKGLSRYALHTAGGKAAVVVSKTADYCLAEMAKFCLPKTPREMRVFRTLARAQLWLRT